MTRASPACDVYAVTGPNAAKLWNSSDLLPLPNLEKWAIWKLFSEKNMFTPKTRIQNVFKLYKDHVGMLEIAWK